MTEAMPSPATDPEGFKRWLHAGAERGRRIARARPTLRDVAAPLLAFGDSMTEAIWGGPDTDRSREHPIRPLDGAAANMFGTPTLNPNMSLTLEVADGYITAVRDHLLGLTMLAGIDGPGRSVLALARTLFDVAIHAAYLLEPSIDDQERTLRTYNFLMEAVRQEVADGGDITQLVERQDELRDAARTDGFTFATITTRGGTTRENLNALAPRRTDAEIREHVQGETAEATWRDLSSVTHGQERTHLQFMLGTGPISPGPHRDAYIALATIPAVEAAILAADHAQGFYGLAGEAISEEIVTVVRKTLMLASGMADSIVEEGLAR